MTSQQVEPEPEVTDGIVKVKGLLGVVTYVVDKPQSLAIIFALVLLAMFLGVVPSTISSRLEHIDTQLDSISASHGQIMSTTQSRYDDLQSQLNIQNDSTKDQFDKMIQIMRGMCLIIAKQSNDSAALSYCNP